MGNACCGSNAINYDDDVNLFHFSLLRNVGKGAFGKVRVVRHKRTNEMYALKYINKAKCVKMKAVANMIQERRLLEEIDHAYIVNMRYAFQDDENCFYVLDLMLGGDLRFHLDRAPGGRLAEPEARFWLAQIAAAVAYLHERRIVHRDIKPDNILLSAAGHAHLTDFNIASHFAPDTPLMGVAGSLAYMAPEVLARRGYSCAADWWSLGVCAFELLTGRRPFRGASGDELRAAIAHAPLAWPPAHGSPDARDAVSRMLERSPAARLGCVPRGRAGLDAVVRHPWFAPLDWPALERKAAPSPFVPDPNKAHFDATYDLEELLLEDNPLRARARKVQDVSKLSAELRTLEEKFTSYDFTRMRRRSYYPANHVVSELTSSLTMTASRPASPATLADRDPAPPPPAPAHAHAYRQRTDSHASAQRSDSHASQYATPPQSAYRASPSYSPDAHSQYSAAPAPHAYAAPDAYAPPHSYAYAAPDEPRGRPSRERERAPRDPSRERRGAPLMDAPPPPPVPGLHAPSPMRTALMDAHAPLTGLHAPPPARKRSGESARR